MRLNVPVVVVGIATTFSNLWLASDAQFQMHQHKGDLSSSVFNVAALSDSDSLVSHPWVCISLPMPTGLYLFRTFYFHDDHNFRSFDSMQERPPVRVQEGTWMITTKQGQQVIEIKYKTWRIASENEALESSGYFGFSFIDEQKSAFETTVSYSTGPVDFICGSSLDDIMARRLPDVLARDVEKGKQRR
jgi:hypothetical protein